MTNRTLLLGWWGVWAFFANWGILLNNLRARRDVAALSAPMPGEGAVPTPLSAPMDPGRPLLQRAGALAIGGLVVVSVIAGAVAESNKAARADDTGEVSRGGELDVFDLRVGDCFDSPGADAEIEISDVNAVPCQDLHDYEVFRLGDFDDARGAPFPGASPVFEQAGLRCLEAFEPFVGVPYPDSVIDVTVMAPTRESWERGDREYACLAYDLGGPVRGSLRGVQR